MTRAMDMLAEDPRVLFIGQAVACPGTTMSATLANVPDSRKMELPVAEEMQMGMTVGLAVQGFLPVSIFPRWNFLLLAANQMVNHLDKLQKMGGYRPKAIIRVGVGARSPLWPGHQHVGDYTGPFQTMCPNIAFRRLHEPEAIVPAYRAALERDMPTVLVEFAENYG